ncbi:MAG: lipid A biosynthesis lauroyl acyltransferase [Rhodoplanes sp.]|jgi:KDO2-lipid IV(A) lauroyltransferase
MQTELRQLRRFLSHYAERATQVAARLAIAPLFTLIRRFDRVRASDAMAALMRRVGPWMPEHKTGRANLAAAFPDKSPAEIETILAGVWDNLGRVAVEFAHLDRLTAGDPLNLPYIAYDAENIARYNRLRDDGLPALVFAAHLANWELPAVIAAAFGLDAMIVYRRPNIGAVADAVNAVRAGTMGTLVPTRFDTPIRLARALEQGRHVAMLVDQHDTKGVEVTFFGRKCRANPLIAKLARQLDCPIYGTRMIRLPEGKFRGEITEAIAPVRDADGRIDVQGTMQAITSVVESWVRENPEQWLWLHRRWR